MKHWSDKVALTSVLIVLFSLGNILYQVVWGHCAICAFERSFFQAWGMVGLCAAMIYLDCDK